MSISLIGSGGYFTRLGTFVGAYNRIAALYGTALTVIDFQSIWSQYASSDQAAIVGLPAAQAGYQQTPNSYLGTLATFAQQSSILQVNDNAPLNPYTYIQSVLNVITQMKATAQSVNKPTITTAITAGGSNVGNASFSTSVINPYGVQSDTIYAEAVVATCTSATASFSPIWNVLGVVAVPFTAYNWPQGSGCSLTFTTTDPAATTLVTDGMFVNWSGSGSNTPTNWTIINGTAGTQVIRGSSPIRTGYNYSASIVSDGSSATQLVQQVSLQPNTVYAFSGQMKVSSTDGSGVIRICLTNGDGSTILTNDTTAVLSQTYTMSSGTPSSSNVGTSYATFTVYFATPKYLPAICQIQFGFSTAPTAAKTLSLVACAGVAATQLYAQGPLIASFSGSTANVIGDSETLTYTNSLGTQSFVRGTQRVLNFPNLGSTVYFPSSVSPTVADNLVTNP